MTKNTVWGSLLVLAMAGAGVVSLDIMNDWVGDWGALLWICGAFFFPFVAGLALGRAGVGRRGRAIGAVIGAAVVLVPSIGYAVTAAPDVAELRLPLLWAVFGPLAAVQGAIALPVGTSARSRAPQAQ